jgi:hypothetical protein
MAPERLFIHQFGDGFVVVSDFMEPNPQRPIAICLTVMRYLIGRGVATKAAISGGDFADISSCYRETVLAASHDRRYVKIGEGVMTIIPVMGMALISPHKLANLRSDAVLLLDSNIFISLPIGIIAKPGSPAVIDWVHSDLPLVSEIAKTAGVTTPNASSTEGYLRSYIESNKSTLTAHWISSTLDSVSMTL